MFASKSLASHLFRGALGVGVLALAVRLGATHPLLSLALLPVSLIALRGCPLCWTLGLVQTLVATIQGKSVDACVDGSCALTSAYRLPTPPRGGA